jgi:ParB-like nuclease domain
MEATGRGHWRSPEGDSPSGWQGGGADPAETENGVVEVSIMSLRPADSPRLNGEDKAHIARLAQTEGSLPPILVDRRTMRVIDGMHRLVAASSLGRETISVVFFDGSEADVFLRAVRENVVHGLPLSHADRQVAAARIIASHPHMSNRAIGHAAGLAAKTVAAIRRRSANGAPPPSTRVGRDGRARPLDSSDARMRAADLLAEQPTASLRDVARAVGTSAATVLDVRKRLERGEPPVPCKADAAGTGAAAVGSAGGRADASGAAGAGSPGATAAAGTSLIPPAREAADLIATVEKLLRDPSLRGSDRGKDILRLLHVNAVAAQQVPDLAAAVPPHCVSIIGRLARQYTDVWTDFAQELDGRARITDPSAPAG